MIGDRFPLALGASALAIGAGTKYLSLPMRMTAAPAGDAFEP